ncbi:unnamed protein product [Rotaria sp. Silwood1]|nr:unnamed protein product [Rotaria sp. Silwood1]CAF1663690.1 unnamed protein product [Rotaria sp. Silwood1]
MLVAFHSDCDIIYRIVEDIAVIIREIRELEDHIIYCVLEKYVDDGHCNTKGDYICEDNSSAETWTNVTPIEQSNDKDIIGNYLFGIDNCRNKCKKHGYQNGGSCFGGRLGIYKYRGKTNQT